MSTTWIVIPTYWTDRLKSGIFDHPTPTDGESTLPRLLESLLHQDETNFQVLVLAGGVDDSVLTLAAEAARKANRKYADQLKLKICDIATLANLRDRFDLPGNAFNLTSYAGIRNLQLLIPNTAGAQVVIALDDDEVVAPHYVREVLRLVGEPVYGQPVLGLAGPYEDEHGQLDLVETAETGNIFLDKSRIMNTGLQDLVSQADPVLPSPQVFGGNMIFHRDLFTQVGFDPGITRGEDMDYMINAHLKGFTWYMASDLRITHLPPKQYDIPAYAKLKQDVLRFVYERAKAQSYQIDPAQFDPYPGRFLRADLDAHALEALNQFASPAMVTEYGSPQEILNQAYRHAEGRLPSFANFSAAWPGWMEQTRLSTLPPYISFDG